MEKLKFIISFLFFGLISTFNAQVNFNWAKDFQGNYSTGRDIALSGSGHLYSVGNYSAVVDFDPSLSTFTLSGNGIYLTKFDTLGNFIWAKTIADGSANVTNVKVDASGNIFVFGVFGGIVDFDPSASTFNLTGTTSIFISKLNAAGNFMWAKQIDANSNGSARAMTIDNSGNIIFTGVFANTVDFDPGPATSLITGGSNNIYVAKLDNSGNFVWAHNIVNSNPANADFSTGITADNLDNIYYTFLGTGDVDFGPAVYNVGSANVCKIDANANFIWAKSFTANPRAVAVNSLQEVFFTGWFFGSVDFDPGPAIYNISPSGFDDAFVCKLTPAGNFAWVEKIGGAGSEKSHSIILDANSNSYIGGDAFYAKVNSVGNFTWAKQINPPAIQFFGNGIAIDLNNNFYATGNLSGTGDFDPGPNTYTLSSLSSTVSEAFIFRWSPCTSTISPPTNITNVVNQSICSNTSATLSVNGVPQINWFGYANSPTPIGTGSVFVTPTLSTGTYTFYAESNACSVGRTAITITVNASPTISVNNGSLCSGQSFTINPSGANTYTYSSGSNIVSPSATTSYSIIGTGTNGCVSSNTAIVTLTVHPAPTITVTSGAICSGGSFTINPTGANTYTISGGNFLVTPATTASYSITGTSAAGCITNTSAVSSITVNTLPSVIATTNTSLICTGQSATLTANGANSYFWSTASTNTTIIVSPTVNTTYTVMGTDVNNCSNFSVITQSVSLCTGLAALSGVEMQGIKIYPNPTNAVFNIEIANYESIKIEIYNAMGQLIISKPVTAQLTSVNLAEFANGLYIVKVQSNNEIISFSKLLKQ